MDDDKEGPWMALKKLLPRQKLPKFELDLLREVEGVDLSADEPDVEVLTDFVKAKYHELREATGGLDVTVLN